jgi:hypothetical protein
MDRIVTVAFALSLVASSAWGQGGSDKAKPGDDNRWLLMMPEPPIGYTLSTHAVEADGKRLGSEIQLLKDKAVSRVVITVETASDRSGKMERVAGLKGYVNGAVANLKKTGLELVTKDMPDAEKLDFDAPIQIDLQFTNPQKIKFYLRHYIFFTKFGFNVQILATDEKDLAALSDWAKQVRPATAAGK